MLRSYEISLEPSRTSIIQDAAVDVLKSNGTDVDVEAYVLSVEGWLVAPRRVVAIDFDQDGGKIEWTPARRVPPQRPAKNGAAMRWAFACDIGATSLTPEFEIELKAVLEDGSRIPFAKVAGARNPLCRPTTDSPAPLVVTTLGRSGSTLLLRMLASHPELVAYQPPGWAQIEVRGASFWVDVLLLLTSPSIGLRQAYGDRPMTRGWSTSLPGTFVRPVRDGVFKWIADGSVEETIRFCQRQIAAFHRAASIEAGKPMARYFVEKSQPTAQCSTAEIVQEMSGSAKEIILVRDFRDVVCSWASHAAKAGRRRSDLTRADEEGIAEWAGPIERLHRYWERRSGRSHLLRYEDLIRAPETCVGALLEYLDVRSDSACVRELGQRARVVAPDLAGHPTTPDVTSSVGRWRSEFTPAMRDLATSLFGNALEAFGYCR